MELDFPPFRAYFVSATLGSVLSNGPDAKSVDLHISAHMSSNPARPEFIDLPVCPGHGQGSYASGRVDYSGPPCSKKGIYFCFDLFTLGLGGCCWGRCGDLPLVLGLSDEKDAMIEGVLHRFGFYFPPVSSPLFRQLQWVYGYPRCFCPW